MCESFCIGFGFKAEPLKRYRWSKRMAPAFSLTTPKYDMSTFWGRFMFFVDVTDPRTLLVSKAELERSKQAIEVGVAPKRRPDGADDARSDENGRSERCLIGGWHWFLLARRGCCAGLAGVQGDRQATAERRGDVALQEDRRRGATNRAIPLLCCHVRARAC